MRLCGGHDGFKGAVGLSLSHVVLQGDSQDGELVVGLETTEGLLRLQHAGGGPSEGHLGMAPALDVALDDADGETRDQPITACCGS